MYNSTNGYVEAKWLLIRLNRSDARFTATSPAICAGKRDASNRVIGPMPLAPARRLRAVSDHVAPSGLSTWAAVMTIRVDGDRIVMRA